MTGLKSPNTFISVEIVSTFSISPAYFPDHLNVLPSRFMILLMSIPLVSSILLSLSLKSRPMGPIIPTLADFSGIRGRWNDEDNPACTAEPPSRSEPLATDVSISSYPILPTITTSISTTPSL